METVNYGSYKFYDTSPMPLIGKTVLHSLGKDSVVYHGSINTWTAHLYFVVQTWTSIRLHGLLTLEPVDCVQGGIDLGSWW
jgi:hypothetical protein